MSYVIYIIWSSAMTQVEVINFVRIILGGLPIDILPDNVIVLFYNRWSLYFDLTNNPEKLPLVLWNVCVSCLEWLIAKSTMSGGYNTERTEKIGQEQISVKGGSQIQAWKDLLDYITDKSVFSYENGFVKIPSGPGLGITVNEEHVIKMAKEGHNWRNPLWRHADGSVAEW